MREYGFLAPAAKKMRIRIQLLVETRLPVQKKPEAPKVLCECCKKPMKMIIHKIHFQCYEKREKARSPPEKTP